MRLSFLFFGLAASLAAQTRIVVNPAKPLKPISPSLYGTNHRFFNDGVGSWDSAAARMRPEFTKAHAEIGLKSMRYPGGTAGNLFEWKKAIGPVEKRGRIRRSHGEVGKPVYLPSSDVRFGVDEAAQWCRQNGVELVYMYNMANGSSADAADLVEYLNAPLGTNPNGGVAWAEVRAKNGSPEPYGIRFFEIGNEMNGPTQRFWLAGIEIENKNQPKTFQEGQNAYAREYAFGGIAKIEREWVGDLDDQTAARSLSTGDAGQIRFIKFPPAVAGSEQVFVGDKQWTRVESLQGTRNGEVYTFEPATGQIRFGDGEKGALPPKGDRITATYRTRRDGFAAYVKALKAADARVKVYAGYESQHLIEAMGADHPYDGIAIHPYTKQRHFTKDLTPDEFHHYMMKAADDRALEVQQYLDLMAAKVGPSRIMSTPITEYGYIQFTAVPFPSMQQYLAGLERGLYVTQTLMHFIRQGLPYANKHSTIGGADGVIGDAPSFHISAAGRAFEMFTHMFGTELITSTIEGNPERALRAGETLPKLDAIASRDQPGTVYLMVINRDATDAVSASVELPDATTGPVTRWVLNADTYTTMNTAREPDRVKITRDKLPAANQPFMQTFAAHSVTALKFAIKR